MPEAQTQTTPVPLRVPEILAPAGGREQFFAALNSGADAVFLGLKQFNARGRAENFTIEDLCELAPLARRQGMKILVTLNILIKDSEFSRLADELSLLQWVGVHAVIVQDIGVARFIRKHFPSIRMHASTQLAVHNLAGVLKAIELGFKRVVVARELTAQELRRIQAAVEGTDVEIEAFCHGSLCYSYSGLCFFSGAEDARSGNRGECAYTCRKPYKILNEPGHGFLFSMKDLNTVKDLGKLVDANIHTLKIEGRKKDAQFVTTSVGLYRQELNKIFGRETGPLGRSIERDYRHDMAFSFHRDMTSFFVNGRYHENVIDLNNPTHKGLKIGAIEKIRGRTIELLSHEALEKFDGLRIESQASLYHAKPQHGETVSGTIEGARRRYKGDPSQFSLRDFGVRGRRMNETAARTHVEIELPAEVPLPKVGDLVYKVRSNELKRHTEALSKAPHDARLRPLRFLQLAIGSVIRDDQLSLTLHFTLGGRTVFEDALTLPYAAAKDPASDALRRDLRDGFALLGDAGLECELTFAPDFVIGAFVPRSQIKSWKQTITQKLPAALEAFTADQLDEANGSLTAGRRRLPAAESARFAIKIDRLEYLPWLATAKNQGLAIEEIVFEPKRAFLGKLSGSEMFAQLFSFVRSEDLKLRFALPTVLRAWDEPLLKTWIKAYLTGGGRAFELGNVGAFELLRQLTDGVTDLDLSSDFSLYALNTEAVQSLKELGVQTAALSIEDDSRSLSEKLSCWPDGIAPQIILYKDTPLFIAEACSLTALHQGCPTSAVCGYRTLEIENDEGERFFVAHESCKSIVYGEKALGWSQFRGDLQALGVAEFRIDFLTKAYGADEFLAVLRGIQNQSLLTQTHCANYERQLL